MHLCASLALGCKYCTFSWSAGRSLSLNNTEACNNIYQRLLSVPSSLLRPWSRLLLLLSVVWSRYILFAQLRVERTYIYSWCHLKCICVEGAYTRNIFKTLFTVRIIYSANVQYLISSFAKRIYKFGNVAILKWYTLPKGWFLPLIIMLNTFHWIILTALTCC